MHGRLARTVCIKAGTYDDEHSLRVQEDEDGHGEQPGHRSGDPNSTTKPVLNFSSQVRVGCGDNPDDGNLGGLTVNADYVTVKNIVVQGANDNCIKVREPMA